MDCEEAFLRPHEASANLVLPAVLAAKAAADPGKRLYLFLTGEDQTEEITYGQIHRNAIRIAMELKAKTQSGDRVALLYPPGPHYIAAFVACLVAGVVPVPCYPPRNARQAERTRKVIDDCTPALALTAPGDAARMRGFVECPNWSEVGYEAQSVAPT
ncbi:MAG: AMP-binding protein, partial [Aliidongia sp.]